MFKRRDIPPVVLLLVLLLLVMLTLSQILVVHNRRNGRNVHNMRRLQLELRELDLNLHSLMMQNVPSIELNRRMLVNQINTNRFADILKQASESDLKHLPNRTLRHKLDTTMGEGFNFRDASELTHDQLSSSQTTSAQESISDNSEQTGNSTTYCPSVPPHLRGRVPVDVDHTEQYTVPRIMAQYPRIAAGGQWRPTECMARHRVAIVIPYRDREQHLLTLLAHLHPILQTQQLDYRIIVVEQYGTDTFNKARIMNIAYLEGLKLYNFQCFVFHDVDLVPEDDRNMYSCPIHPRHMSVAIDEMGYKLAYQELVGGVLNLRTEHFQWLNGYSNLYWGWGAEDDDMAYRIMHVGLKITRPPDSVARYKMIKHTKRKPSDWRKRAKLLYTGTRRFQFDGLNSLQYQVTSIKLEPLYTHLLVEIGKPPKGF